MSKQKVCTILLLLFWYRPNYIVGTTLNRVSQKDANFGFGLRDTSPEIRASPTPSVDSIPALDLGEKPKTGEAITTIPKPTLLQQHIDHHAQSAQEVEIDEDFFSPKSNVSGISYQTAISECALSTEEEPASPTPRQFILPTPQTHIYISYSYNHDYEVRDVYVHIVGKRFNEKVGYDDLYYWKCKVDKLLSMMHDGYLDIDEDDIDEIRRNAPELYSKYRRQFEEYMERKIDQSLLFSESSFVLYIPEEIARGEKKQEHKEEVVIHLTSDPKLFDKVFRVVPIRERPKVSEASKIRREKQEAEYREQQRIHAEQYKAKERALKRANGEDMIFDPRVGKRVHFEDYLRSLFLSQLAEPRARNNVSLPSKGRF